MSLAALQNVDPATAKGALASTVISIAGPGLEFVPDRYSELAHALVAEARGALDLPPGDDSARAYEAIRGYLSKEVDRQLFKGVDRTSLRNELGRKGELPLSAYKLKFSRDFDEARKENKGFIERSLRTAERYEHHAVGIADKLKIERGSSLFAKLVTSVDRKRTHILLIDTIRAGTTLDINRVWHLFPEILDLDQAATPIQLLQVFVHHYGFDVEYRGYQKAKLTVDLELPSIYQSPSQIDAIRVIHHGEKDCVATEVGTSVTLSDGGNEHPVETYILLSYAIDVQKYRSDLRRLG